VPDIVTLATEKIVDSPLQELQIADVEPRETETVDPATLQELQITNVDPCEIAHVNLPRTVDPPFKCPRPLVQYFKTMYTPILKRLVTPEHWRI
jgi:hypothetical protein